MQSPTTTLFKLVIDRNWSEVIKRCERNSREASMWVVKNDRKSVVWRRLPLHEACISKAPEEVISVLIVSYPEGVSSPDSYGRLPLHHACIHGNNLGVMKLLVLAYPKSIEVKDVWDKTPLSTVETSTLSNKDEIVEVLLENPIFFAEKATELKKLLVEKKLKESYDQKLKEILDVVTTLELALGQQREKYDIFEEKCLSIYLKVINSLDVPITLSFDKTETKLHTFEVIILTLQHALEEERKKNLVMDERYSSINCTLHVVSQNKQELEEIIEHMKKSETSLKTEIIGLNEKVGKTKLELGMMLENNIEIENNAKDIFTYNEKLMEELNETKLKEQDCREVYETTLLEKEALEVENKLLTDKETILEKSVAFLQEIVDERTNKFLMMKKKVSEFEQGLQHDKEYEGTIIEIQTHNEVLNKSFSEEKRKNRSLMEEYQIVVSQKDELESSNHVFKEIVARLEKSVSFLTEQVEERKKRDIETKNQRNELVNLEGTHQSHAEPLRTEFHPLEQNISQKELNNLKLQYEDLEVNHNEAKEKLIMIKAEKEEEKNKIAEIEKQNLVLTERLKEENLKHRRLESTFQIEKDKLEAKPKKLEEDVSYLENSVSFLRQVIEEQTKKYLEMKNNKTEYNSKEDSDRMRAHMQSELELKSSLEKQKVKNKDLNAKLKFSLARIAVVEEDLRNFQQCNATKRENEENSLRYASSRFNERYSPQKLSNAKSFLDDFSYLPKNEKQNVISEIVECMSQKTALIPSEIIKKETISKTNFSMKKSLKNDSSCFKSYKETHQNLITKDFPNSCHAPYFDFVYPNKIRKSPKNAEDKIPNEQRDVDESVMDYKNKFSNRMEKNVGNMDREPISNDINQKKIIYGVELRTVPSFEQRISN